MLTFRSVDARQKHPVKRGRLTGQNNLQVAAFYYIDTFLNTNAKMVPTANQMDSQKLETLISDAKNSLLQLARESCWNKLADKCLYILTFYENSELNFHKQREIRKTVNDKLKPQRLADLLPQLLSIYDNIHNIELFLYKADKEFNTIEIQVYTKSLLEPKYREKLRETFPAFIAKSIFLFIIIILKRNLTLTGNIKLCATACIYYGTN